MNATSVTSSGQPNTENGKSADENQVSRTSSSKIEQKHSSMLRQSKNCLKQIMTDLALRTYV